MKSLDDELLQQNQIPSNKTEREKRAEERIRELEAASSALEQRNMKLLAASRELKASRYRYWSLYNWSPVGYLALDHDLCIRELNVAAARLLGAKRADLIGSCLSRHLSEENRALLLDSFEKCVNTSHDEVELQVRLLENRYAYVQIQCEPYHIHGQKDWLYRMAILDISKLKDVESKLKRLNRLYAVLTATDNAIIHAVGRNELFDEICRIAVEQGGFGKACIGWRNRSSGTIEPAATASTGQYSTNIVCIWVNESLHGSGPIADAIREKGHYVSNDCDSDRNTAGIETRCGEFGVKSAAVFALAIAGEVVGAFSMAADEVDYFDRQMMDLLSQMAADISFALENMEKETRRREAEEALRRETLEKLEAIVELRRKEQLLLHQSRQAAMGELLGNIAHHWRQPLNVIALIIQDLELQYEQGMPPGYLADGIHKAMDVIQQLSQTINDFRNFFRPDHTRSLFKLNDAVARTLSLVEASFRDFQFSTSVRAEEEIFVNGYQHEFSQVLLNIMLNARDAFVEKQVAKPRVEICLFSENGWGIVTVTDNAGGIPENVLHQVFEPYFTTKPPDKGSGIGLYMAKTIVEKNMNGRLTVRNTGEGAEFRIELPA